ncbi:periplasmic heavy metal sensor [Novosphingobium sp. P6W]|uniref:periplasmic heavy metal sensor n=1 Tax=Novosphingobium sp. P6W TaxID=1609758 RepID=UPI0005C2DF0F|nr:periplasmic heavy metal sensor [Novosphingobium sp. P6W]AXB76641.1 hypothetical protein TQ38_009190 [Novosphingobium sp. P6W]KIS29859.1 hypothetical protein TQ38_26030 [Novosphingobium sp. P6W]
MKGRGFQILLVCSLVLNVFMIGGLVGAGVMWERAEVQPPVNGLGRAGRLRMAAQDLPQPYRRDLRRTVAETMRTLKLQLGEGRAARREAARLLAQPTLDQAALDATLARGRAADSAVRTRLEASIAGFAAGLPQQERLRLLEALTRQQPRSPGQEKRP